MLCELGGDIFVRMSWVCKAQTASHSNTEADMMSLDTDLRMEELLALKLCVGQLRPVEREVTFRVSSNPIYTESKTIIE